ncbi:MAG: CoA-binding protein [Bacteroidales bacterium]|nr:CoA-binding protein [Bacteroidales bacterium]
MGEHKTTLVIGASEKPERFSNKAIRKLVSYGHPVEAIGLRNGDVSGISIQTGFPHLENIHTVTMYVGPARQLQYYSYLLGLNPKRIIFNPGTENSEFMQKAEKQGIEVVPDCTLVMLDSGSF